MRRLNALTSASGRRPASARPRRRFAHRRAKRRLRNRAGTYVARMSRGLHLGHRESAGPLGFADLGRTGTMTGRKDDGRDVLTHVEADHCQYSVGAAFASALTREAAGGSAAGSLYASNFINVDARPPVRMCRHRSAIRRGSPHHACVGPIIGTGMLRLAAITRELALDHPATHELRLPRAFRGGPTASFPKATQIASRLHQHRRRAIPVVERRRCESARYRAAQIPPSTMCQQAVRPRVCKRRPRTALAFSKRPATVGRLAACVILGSEPQALRGFPARIATCFERRRRLAHERALK